MKPLFKVAVLIIFKCGLALPVPLQAAESTNQPRPLIIITNKISISSSRPIIYTNLEGLPADATYIVATNVSIAKRPVKYPREGINWPRLRHDWTDVLVSEDPSDPALNSLPASYADIKGATFTYSQNAINKSNSWTADGALILPIVFYPALHEPGFTAIALAPSVSLDKEANNLQPSNDVDHLDFRLGLYTKILGLTNVSHFDFNAQIRAAFVYGTDTGFHASLPAAEVELEPMVIFHDAESGTIFPDWVSLGYQNILYGKRDGKPSDDIIDFKCRAWLHFEAGDLQQNGAMWNTVDGSFVRLGPTVQGQVSFNKFLNGFSISAQYGYQGVCSGPAGRNSLYSFSGALNIYKNDAQHQKVALTASYTKGGLLLSKQEVNILNIGLGIIF